MVDALLRGGEESTEVEGIGLLRGSVNGCDVETVAFDDVGYDLVAKLGMKVVEECDRLVSISIVDPTSARGR